MTYFTTELKSILIFVIASLVLSLILFLAVYIMSFTSKVEFEKSSAYECGFAPFSETNFPFEVQFALIAIMFLLFDIEVLYLYPLVTSISDLTFYDLTWFLMFFIILVVGIAYEISRHIMAMGQDTRTGVNKNHTVRVPGSATPMNGDIGSGSASGSSSGFLSYPFHKTIAINPLAIILGVNTSEVDQVLLSIVSLYFLFYFLAFRRSTLSIGPAVFPFVVQGGGTPDEVQLVNKATEFIFMLVNKMIPSELIIELARIKNGWVFTGIDIESVIHTMKLCDLYKPVADPKYLAGLKKVLAELGSNLPDLVPVPDPGLDSLSDSLSTVSDSSSTVSDVVSGAAYWFQETWWFPIAVVGSVTVIFLGLAEARNRYYPELSPQQSNITADTEESEIYYSFFEESYSLEYISLYFIFWFTLLGTIYQLVNHYVFNLSIRQFIIILVPWVSVGVLVIVYPTFAMLIMLSFCTIVLITSVNYEFFKGFQKTKEYVLGQLLLIFKYIGVIDVCSIVYILVFCISPIRNTVLLLILFSFNLMYILVSRYHFITSQFYLETNSFVIDPIIIYTLLLIGLMFLYLRLFIIFSSSIVLVTKMYSPNLLHPDILFVFGLGEGGTQTPPVPPTPPIPRVPAALPPVEPNERHYSFLNVNYTRNYYQHHYTDAVQNAARLRNFGMVAGIIGVGVGIATAKFTYDAAVAAREQVVIAHDQVRAQEANNYEMTVQNSLEALSQNLMTKEEFLMRHPEFSQPKAPTDGAKK